MINTNTETMTYLKANINGQTIISEKEISEIDSNVVVIESPVETFHQTSMKNITAIDYAEFNMLRQLIYGI